MNSNRKIVTGLFATVFFGLLFVAFYLLSYERSQAEKILYTGKENHLISLERAKQLTEAFQITAKPGDMMAAFLGRDIFQKILNQQECVGIRIYNAISEKGTPTFVIVGVDGNGNDMVGGPVGEEVLACPPWCPPGKLTLISTQGDIVTMK